jgi:hypothetical protein
LFDYKQRPATNAYRDNWERIFSRLEAPSAAPYPELSSPDGSGPVPGIPPCRCTHPVKMPPHKRGCWTECLKPFLQGFIRGALSMVLALFLLGVLATLYDVWCTR